MSGPDHPSSVSSPRLKSCRCRLRVESEGIKKRTDDDRVTGIRSCHGAPKAPTSMTPEGGRQTGSAVPGPRTRGLCARLTCPTAWLSLTRSSSMFTCSGTPSSWQRPGAHRARHHAYAGELIEHAAVRGKRRVPGPLKAWVNPLPDWQCGGAGASGAPTPPRRPRMDGYVPQRVKMNLVPATVKVCRWLP